MMIAKATHKPGTMNKTEAAYADHLELQRRLKQILSYCFEPLKLRLGKKCWYTPDFLVVNAEGELELHEVKAYWPGKRGKSGRVGGRAGWREDGRVKWKAAAARYPFRFVAAWRTRGGWQYEVAQ